MAWELHEIGLPARLSGSLAERLIEDETGSLQLSALVGLRADLQRLFDVVDLRLAEASQTIVVRARGRRRGRQV